MYISEIKTFEKQKRKKPYILVICVVFLVSLCAIGLWKRGSCEKAEASDVSDAVYETIPPQDKEIPQTSISDLETQEPEVVEDTKEDTKEEPDISRPNIPPLIILDAGHGGEDEGCKRGETEEKTLNLELTYALKTKLEEMGFAVQLTREDDKMMTLEERVLAANDARGDLLISIHQNSSEYEEAEGVETWYCKEEAEESERLAKLVQQYMILHTKAKDRGIAETDTLYIIRECDMPSCLVEVGFLSHAKESENLLKEEYYEKIVEGLADAVWYFFNPKKMYLTFDDGPSTENTGAILDVLKEKGIQATFFVVGENVKKRPEMLKRIVEEGHTIGIHCYNHDYDILYESVESYLEDFERAREIIYEVTGEEVWCYRFPGGSINRYNEEISQEIIGKMTEKGYIYYDWNACLEDSVKNPEPEQMIENARESTLQRKKVVMLAHDMVYATAQCMEELLEDFPEYEFLPLTKEVEPIQFKR